VATGWWPVRLSRYRPASLDLVLAPFLMVCFVLVLVTGPVAQVRAFNVVDPITLGGVGAVAVFVGVVVVVLGCMAWRLGVAFDASNVTVTYLWRRKHLPRPEVQGMLITYEARRVRGFLQTPAGLVRVWPNYIGRHRHLLVALPKSPDECLSCTLEQQTLRRLAWDLGVHAEG
jgi:hypothetical protein